MTYDDVNNVLKYDEGRGLLLWWTKRPGVRVGAKAGFMLNGTQYVIIDRQRYIAARLVWLLKTGSFPDSTVYYLDGNRANIRYENLSLTKPRAVRERLRICEGQDGSLRVVAGGSTVAESDDPEKILGVIRALLLY